MNTNETVTQEAMRLYRANDIEALVASVGRRDIAVRKNAATPIIMDETYESTIMGMDEARALGRKVLRRWNKEVYQLVCPAAGARDKDAEALLKALNLGEVAVVGSVAGLLISLAVPAPVAAALAALIVKKFIWPAKDELCTAWAEAISSES